MNRKNLLITGSLTGVIIILLLIGIFMFPNYANADDSAAIPGAIDPNVMKDPTFDTSTPEATAISIARLNEGQDGFNWWMKANASLTPDGKYWIVNMYNENYEEEGWVVTVDAQTGMSRKNGSLEYMGTDRPNLLNTWRSLDELKAQYIAEIQICGSDGSSSVGKPQKITMDGKEIWKVPIKVAVFEYSYTGNEIYTGKNKTEYVYVDLATGKSKNTFHNFNESAGTDGWLTLEEVDTAITKMYGSEIPFKDVLRDLYSKNAQKLFGSSIL